MFTDSHTHLDLAAFASDRSVVLKRAREAKVNTLINVGMGPDRSQLEQAYDLVQKTEGMYLTVGIHPHDAKEMQESSLTILREFLGREKTVAIGEIGLDYHYDNSPREKQLSCFAEQLDLAKEEKKPVSIHSREAFADIYRLTKERNTFSEVGGALHCFSGSPQEAEAYLALGAYLSYSGIITFKKAEELRKAVEITPLDRLLVETDSPFLAPVPFRGKRNESAYVVHVAKTVAQIRGLSVEEVGKITTENATRLFHLPT